MQSLIFTGEETNKLEESIDALTTKLKPLKKFILAGGCKAAAHAHMARSVCRRAERSLVAMIESECGSYEHYPGETEKMLAYLNRLSDFFFTYARFINMESDVEDVVWLSKNDPTRSN
jgi:cob(I)alamin adenosyltransferase